MLTVMGYYALSLQAGYHRIDSARLGLFLKWIKYLGGGNLGREHQMGFSPAPIYRR